MGSNSRDWRAYEGMVKQLAKKSRVKCLDYDERVSAAWSGVLTALRTWSPEKGASLPTWCYIKARYAIENAARRENRASRRAKKIARQLSERPIEQKTAPYMLIERAEKREAVRKVIELGLETLDARTAQILRLSWFEGLTQFQIGKRLGITQCWCSRLYARGMEQLSKFLAERHEAIVLAIEDEDVGRE